MSINAQVEKSVFEAGYGFRFSTLSCSSKTAIQCTLFNRKSGCATVSAVVDDGDGIEDCCQTALSRAFALLLAVQEGVPCESSDYGLSGDTLLLFGKYKGMPFATARKDPDFKRFLENVKNTKMHFPDQDREEQRVALCALEVSNEH